MVARPDDSVTGRWLRSLLLSGVDVALFATSALHAPLLPEDVPTQSPLSLWASTARRRTTPDSVRELYGRTLDRFVMPHLVAWRPDWTARRLARVIADGHPDLVHCLDPWAAAEAVGQCLHYVPPGRVPVVVSVTSNDLRLAAIDPVREAQLVAALAVCDCCLVERESDRHAVHAKAPALRVLLFEPLCGAASGPPHISPAVAFPGHVSKPTIVVDGTRSWLHRPFVALRALQIAARELARFRVIVDTADSDVALVASLLDSDSDLEVEVVDFSREWAWAASVVPAEICVSLSLGNSLEWRPLQALCAGAALVCGPVAALKEWTGGRLALDCVSPEDPSAVSRALAAIAGAEGQKRCLAHANQSVATETFGIRAFSVLIRRQYEALCERAT